ncbi:WD40/YVTN/BNR-like repeat-containing protein [Colwelliaceae bacterium 6441]
MIKKISLIFCLLFNFTVCAEQQLTMAIKSSLAQHSMLFDVVNVNDEFMVTVGERGHILRADTVNSWQQVEVPTQSTLTAVTFVDSSLGWAVGHDGIILHTSNGGMSWQVQQYLPLIQKPLLDIAFKNDSEGIAIGAYGLFYRTTDSGKTWQQEFHTSLLSQDDLDYLDELKQEDEQAYLEERASILPHFNRIFIDGRTTYLVGEVGLIAKSNDFGQSWQRFDDIYQGSFFDIARTKQGNLLAVGLRGNTFRSLTNGTPWQKSETGVTSLLNSIVATDDEQLFLLGNNGVLLTSSDDGMTFQNRTQDDGKALLAGTIFNNSLVVASEVGIKVLQVMK